MMNINRFNTDTTLLKKTLQTIYERKQVSRGELTEVLDLSLTTVTKYVSSLISEGVVIECGTLESTGGRKTNLLGINPEYAYVLGIDIGGYAAKLGVVRMDGTLVEDWFIRAGNDRVPVATIGLQGLQELIAQILDKYDINRFLAICVGISGMVDHEGGKVIFCPNLDGWNNILLADILRERFGLPVFVDTSARCIALAEQSYGAGQDAANQIFVSLGNYDIASAIIIDNRLYRGSGGFAGEIGHVMSSEKGDRCTCGNYGCLELTATLFMIISRIHSEAAGIQGYSPLLQLLPENWQQTRLTPQIIQQAIENGDKLCYEAVATAGRHIGIALSNLLNVINPALVILGGSVIDFFPMILETIRHTVRERVLVAIGQNLDIRPAKMDWRGAVAGSALMALEEFFK